MTLLINKNSGARGSTVRNYTIPAAHTNSIVAALVSQQYTKGSVFINDTVNSLFFEYSIINFNGVLNTTIHGMIGHEFNLNINDFIDSTNIGISITNNEISTLFVTLIQEL